VGTPVPTRPPAQTRRINVTYLAWARGAHPTRRTHPTAYTCFC